MDNENKNQFQIEITAFAFGGAGVGKLPDGKVCFVRGAAPGELVTVELKADKGNYCHARLVSVDRASVHRIVPDCPLAVNGCDNGKCCPGCSYGFVDYDTELAWKQRQLEGFLLRDGLVDKSRVRQPEAAPSRYGWRNKIRLTVGKDFDGNPSFGYKGEDNVTVIDVPDCPLARKSIREALVEYRKNPPEEGTTHVTFRWTLKNGVLTRSGSPAPEARFLTEQLGRHGDFLVPEGSFFQINVPMAAKLAEAAARRIEAGSNGYLVELFCGVGVLSLAAAQMMDNLRVRGAELDKLAIQAAQLNAKKRHLSNRCHYEAGDAEILFPSLTHDMVPAKTMVLVDPPRCGLTASLCRKIIGYGPKTILYVSCAPDTLKRDLKIFCNGGYEVCDAKLFDLFPGTAHFETMTVLRKKV